MDKELGGKENTREHQDNKEVSFALALIVQIQWIFIIYGYSC
jgi:hypothetical protein